MKLFNGSKAVRSLTVSLLALFAVLAVPLVQAQLPNAPTPGELGGYDKYQNIYPPQNAQFFSAGSWSAVNNCLAPGNPVVTISIASPGVITAANTCAAGQAIVFQTTSALPTGLTAGTLYYVIAAGLTTSSFEVSTSVGGSAVNTSGSQSGTQSAWSVYSNATTGFTAAIVTNAVPPGFTVPGHCHLSYTSTNASGTIELAASVSNAASTLSVLSSAHTGSGGATLADVTTNINTTTATAISSTIGGGTAGTIYGIDLTFTLFTNPAQTTPTSITFYAESSSASYTQSLQPPSYCVLGS